MTTNNPFSLSVLKQAGHFGLLQLECLMGSPAPAMTIFRGLSGLGASLSFADSAAASRKGPEVSSSGDG